MKPKTEINRLNVLMCLLVILIHALSAPMSAAGTDSPVYPFLFLPWRLSAFVVQGFLLLSAVKLFLKYKNTPFRYGEFLSRRGRAIVIPYLLWCVIYYLYFCLSPDYAMTFSLPELLRYIAAGDLVAHLYFVIIIVQCYLLMPLWRLMVRKVSPLLAIPGALLITLLLGQWLPDMLAVFLPNHPFVYNDRIVTSYLIFWVAGCYIGEYYEEFLSLLDRHKPLLFSLFGITVLLNGGFSCLSAVKGIPMPFLETVHLAYRCCAVLGCFAFFAGYQWKEGKLFRAVNGVSYEIYLSHCLVIFVLDSIMQKSGITGIPAQVFRLIAIYLLSVGLCLIYGKIRSCLLRRKT